MLTETTVPEFFAVNALYCSIFDNANRKPLAEYMTELCSTDDHLQVVDFEQGYLVAFLGARTFAFATPAKDLAVFADPNCVSVRLDLFSQFPQEVQDWVS